MCDEGKTLTLYLIHAVAVTRPHTVHTHILEYVPTFIHASSQTHTVWPRTLQSTRVCMAEHTYMHSCCSNPITKSESLHKLLSVVAACPVKVKELFFSEPAVWQIPAFAIYICAQPDSSSLSSYSFIFLHLHVLKKNSPSFCFSFIYLVTFLSFIHPFSVPAFFLFFLHVLVSSKKKKPHPPSSLCLLFWFSEPHSFIVSLFEP